MAGSELTPQEQIDLIFQNLQEVMRPDIIEDIIFNQKRSPVVYWGSATTGRPHCGYFVPMVKIAQLLHAGCHVKILLADIHGFLDNLKAPIDLVKVRAGYYKYVIQAALKAVGVSIDKLEFILGSSYQLTPEYTMDLFKLSSMVSEHDSKKAGAEVVKQSANAPLSGLIYPLMQTLDEVHLKVDVQFGGADQRKIFALAAEVSGKIGPPGKQVKDGYGTRAHLMNPMVPGLAGGKMSASDPDSKIDLLEEPKVVEKKLKKAFAVPKEVEGNGIISFVEYVLLPISALKNNGKGRFVVEKREEPPLEYTDIEKLKEDYKNDILTPQLLKSGVTKALNVLLEPIRAEFESNSEWQQLEKEAYPTVDTQKKQKKVKNKGSRHPGAGKKNEDAQVVAQPDGSLEGKEKEKVSLGAGVEDAMEKLEVANKEV
ncbi:MAG: hypothetical protein M1834_008347 [Cirrosporium novae-zelandiae]|nr:MAG: hypothetical protein M1834_008347 [Cirrosporium novae-zelandiae]